MFFEEKKSSSKKKCLSKKKFCLDRKIISEDFFLSCQVKNKYFSSLTEKFRKFFESSEHFAEIICLRNYFSESHFSRILENFHDSTIFRNLNLHSVIGSLVNNFASHNCRTSYFASSRPISSLEHSFVHSRCRLIATERKNCRVFVHLQSFKSLFAELWLPLIVFSFHPAREPSSSTSVAIFSRIPSQSAIMALRFVTVFIFRF